MNRTRMGLALAATAWFVLSAAGAPAPTPPSEGPISDALAVRGLLGNTAPPSVNTALLVEKGVLEMERQVMVPEARKAVESVVGPDGKIVQVERVVTSIVSVSQTVRVKVDGLKFFTVTAEGKLESIDADKATAMLKQKTPVLTGAHADVESRHLELVKPGTLYFLMPAPPLEPIPQPLPAPPDDAKRI